jgi:hypothetical protein
MAGMVLCVSMALQLIADPVSQPHAPMPLPCSTPQAHLLMPRPLTALRPQERSPPPHHHQHHHQSPAPPPPPPPQQQQWQQQHPLEGLQLGSTNSVQMQGHTSVRTCTAAKTASCHTATARRHQHVGVGVCNPDPPCCCPVCGGCTADTPGVLGAAIKGPQSTGRTHVAAVPSNTTTAPCGGGHAYGCLPTP